MKSKVIAIAFAAVAVVSGIGLVSSRALAQEKEDAVKGNASTPLVGKISPWKAIKIAQEKVPGKPLQATYEFDEGHWIYGVMIVHDHKISEVEIDPVTGKIGDTEDVTPAGEAKEVQQELTKAIG